MKKSIYGIHPIYGLTHHHISRLVKDIKAKRIVDVGGKGILNHYLNCKVANANIKKGIDGTNLPYKANSFDAVVSVATLEHVKNQAAFLRESIRVAKRLVVHWFPYGEGAERAEKLKLRLGHRHFCKLPTKSIITKALGQLKVGKLYPLMTISEHLLLLAARHPRLSRRELYDYVYRRRAVKEYYGFILCGKPR